MFGGSMSFLKNPFIALIATVGAGALGAQIVPTGPQNRPALARTEAVTYLFPEQVTIAAGKPSQVEAAFSRLGQGLHINSHTPSADYLIPTDFSIPDSAGVKLDGAAYPEGKIITLPFDPTTKLSVYTGEFIIEARIAARPQMGNHLGASQAALPGVRPEPVPAAEDDQRAD